MMRLVLVAILALGCSKKEKAKDKVEPPPQQTTKTSDLAPCDPPPGPACPYISCGGNSALNNGFPLDGFRPNGDCNLDQMRLVPGSLDGSKCKGMTLDIEGDKLIGRGSAANCEGKDLEGASFEIQTANGSERITIAEVADYLAPNQKKFPAYRMEWTDAGQKTALCSKDGWKLRKKLGVASKWRDDLPDPKNELVIPIVSELYDTSTGSAVTTPKPEWMDKKLEWNHLACVDDAIAKRTINGHYKPNDMSFSRAALRMWTADYCGGRPFTLRGKMFDWGNNPNLVIEAQWNENGATCLSKPRIVFENGQEVAPTKTTKLLDAFCKASGKDCQKVQTWIDEAKHCTQDNNAFKRVEDLKDCGACTAPNCTLESRNVK